jgi:hypothetical protein
MGYIQTKKEIRTPFTDAWEGKEKEKIVPYFTNGNEKKKLKGSAKLWYLLGSN